MSENKELAKAGAQTETAEKPRKSIWNGELKMVRGENTAQLIENFTAEMTLVAEGLCEDQTRLRREVDDMMTQDDRRIQKLESRIDLLETALDEEKKANSKPARDKVRKGNIIRDLTVLVAIAATAWVIVTLVNKLL